MRSTAVGLAVEAMVHELVTDGILKVDADQLRNEEVTEPSDNAVVFGFKL